MRLVCLQENTGELDSFPLLSFKQVDSNLQTGMSVPTRKWIGYKPEIPKLQN